MGLIIRLNDTASEDEWISMSDYDMEGLIALLVNACESLELTESQMALINFIQERIDMIIGNKKSVFLDIDELPWKKSFFPEDKQFLQKLTELAKKPKVLTRIYMKPDLDVVYPSLDKLANLIEQCNVASDGQGEAKNEENMIFFKFGQGWKACRDARRNLYTAERSWRGFYQLCEINKVTYNKLGTDATRDSADRCIGNGRSLFEADDDYYTQPYCTVLYKNYDKLAPWADAKRRYERTYNNEKNK